MCIFLRYGIYTSNTAESLNSSIRGLRNLPILQLVRRILEKTIHDFRERQIRYVGSAGFVKFAYTQVTVAARKGVVLSKTTVTNGNGIGIVTGESMDHQVNVLSRSCTCSPSAAVDLPCRHIFAVMNKDGTCANWPSTVDKMFLCSTYRSAYSELNSLVPASFMNLSITPGLLPPTSMRGRGRPHARILSCLEPAKIRAGKRRCPVCGILGHNRSSCFEVLLGMNLVPRVHMQTIRSRIETARRVNDEETSIRRDGLLPMSHPSASGSP